MAKQGTFNFPGLVRIVSGTFTYSRGIAPSVATIQIVPQRHFPPEIGELRIQYGLTQIRFRDCKIDRANVRNTNGPLVAVRILDRRWRWPFTSISGHYNVKLKNGKIDPDTVKSPKQLVNMLLDAMGERKRFIGFVPNALKPEVKWEDDVASVALDSLCELLGCEILIDRFDTVVVTPIGKGRELPGGPMTEDNEGLDSPEMPDKIRAVANYSRFENALYCEPVGLDNDGIVKPIDDLSYIPGDWINLRALDMSNVENEVDRQLAKNTVFRWFRAVGNQAARLVMNGINDGAGGAIPNIEAIYPLENVRVKEYKDGAKKGQSMPAEAWAFHYDPSGPGGIVSDDDSGMIRRPTKIEPGSFSIDRESGIVKFNQPLRYIDEDDKWQVCPDVMLLCAHPHKLADGTYERHSIEKPTGQRRGTGPLVIKRPDLTYQYEADWFIDDNELPVSDFDFEQGSSDNRGEIDKELGDTINRAIDGFKFSRQHTRAYPDLKKVSLDGKIAQITWTVNGIGTTTTISMNSEHHFGPKAAVRRRQAREKVMDEVAMPLINVIDAQIDMAIARLI